MFGGEEPRFLFKMNDAVMVFRVDLRRERLEA